MSEAKAKVPASDPPNPPPPYTGFAEVVASGTFKHEHEFLRSFYSRPTSFMDEHGNNIYPHGDFRLIMPSQRDVRALGLAPGEPKEKFPAVSWRDGAANEAQDYLRGLIATERGSTSGFTNYEIRLALSRLSTNEGVRLTKKFLSDAMADAGAAHSVNYAALKGVIDALWAKEDSLCRALTRPIPVPIAGSEV